MLFSLWSELSQRLYKTGDFTGEKMQAWRQCSGLRYVVCGDFEVSRYTQVLCATKDGLLGAVSRVPRSISGKQGGGFATLRRRNAPNSQIILLKWKRRRLETKIGGTPHQNRHTKCYSRLCGTTTMEHIHMRYIHTFFQIAARATA